MLFCVVLCEKNITFAAVNLLLSLFRSHSSVGEEHLTHNQGVLGSSPSGTTQEKTAYRT